MTTKEKIDKALGIESNQSIDEFLDSLSIDDQNNISNAIINIDQNIKNNISEIDNKLSVANKNNICKLTIDDINASFSEINEMINVSKKIFQHCYQNIISSDLLDSELISATAKLLESIHISITEFISLYKERMRYFDKIKILYLQQEQRKEIMELKHKHDLELLSVKNTDKNNSISAENLVTYCQESIIKALNELNN